MNKAQRDKYIQSVCDAAYLSKATELTDEKKVLDGIILREASESAAYEALDKLVQTGDIGSDDLRVEYVTKHVLDTDKRFARQGNRLLDQCADGQIPLGDLMDGVIVPLGDNERAIFGDTDGLMLLRHLKLSRENMFNVVQSQAKKERFYNPIAETLLKNDVVMREAHKRGML